MHALARWIRRELSASQRKASIVCVLFSLLLLSSREITDIISGRRARAVFVVVGIVGVGVIVVGRWCWWCCLHVKSLT